ncbi:MAG: tRNA pseudouridine(55) synthase TruB [Lachnospiraceae bacterium]|nr:tRNA pseudouridine(55) synthase TruB [Lachnospiraceae bacterium]
MINGVLNVYKEPGFTSHDVVAKLRGILKQKKIGHMGTLDPYAVGVLPVCLGKGTKLCDMLSDQNKTYKATMLLGMVTDTQDTTGEVLEQVEESKVLQIPEATIFRTVKSYIGDYDQVPPMYSAIKINGQKLYDLARKGEVIERPARRVKIINITITKIDLPRVEMIVECSKGTYIRTLCHDIGQELGCGGCMEKLIRSRVERFDVEDSLTLDQIKELYDTGKLNSKLVPVDEMLSEYSKCVIAQEYSKLIYNGNKFSSRATLLKMNFDDGQKVRVYDYKNEFVGLYQYEEAIQLYKPIKMFL